jgi:Raf kinase inhibitor-like YbhB/YbcL family protein
MWRLLVSVIFFAAAAGCGARNPAANQAKGNQAMENATLTRISLTSSAFQDGQAIPSQYSCDGAGQSPPLAWSEPPQGTKSFALVVDDPDAPSGTFHHWGAYDIPASVRSLDAGAGNSASAPFAQAVNDAGNAGYKGPCPPPGNGPHHYRFKLHALDVDRLSVPPNPKIPDVERAAQEHAIGGAELTGIYERK